MATFPERGLAWLNGVLVAIGDAVMSPLMRVPPLVSLLLLSLLTAVVVVPIIGRLSDQRRVRYTKRQIQAALFEIRLFNDDPRTVMRSVGDALRENLIYLRLVAVPFAAISVPLLMVMAHLQPFYGYTGLDVGSRALLTVVRGDAAPHDAPVSLEAPDSVNVETGPVQLEGTHEVIWRFTPLAPGDHILIVRAGHAAISKSLHVSNGVARRSPSRVQPGILHQLLSPSESPLDAEVPLSAVTISYPEAAIDVVGARLHWTIVYFALTMGWALVLARALRISL